METENWEDLVDWDVVRKGQYEPDGSDRDTVCWMEQEVKTMELKWAEKIVFNCLLAVWHRLQKRQIGDSYDPFAEEA